MPQAAEAAYVEAYDSDQSEIKPGTRVSAFHPPSSRGRSSKAAVQQHGQPYAASDSGYSSYTNNTVASNTVAPRQLVTQETSQRPQTTTSARKPTIHQGQGQTIQTRAPSRSVSVSRSRTTECRDPDCTDPNCLSKRNPDRRYTLPQQRSQPQQQQQQQQSRPQPQQQPSYTTQHYPVQNPPTSLPYQQSPAYTYAQPTATQAVPTLKAQPTPRARAPSVSNARPTSWYGGMYGSTPPQSSYPMSAHGPPPSPSAMFGYGQQHYYAGAVAPQLGSTPPMNAMAQFMQAPAAGMIPPSPQRTSMTTSMTANIYSARQATLPAPNYDMGAMPTSHPQAVQGQGISARRTSFIMPGSFPADSALQDSESDFTSQSDSDSEDDYGRRPRYERDRYDQKERDRKLMPPPVMRRPSLKTNKTTPAASVRTSREPLHRSGRSDSDLDRADSDRTARPVMKQRQSYTSNDSSRSRRPSVSTTSSGRTKGTADSSVSGSATGRYVVEDSRGRRSIYSTREEAERVAHLLARTKLEDDAVAYQSRTSGAQAPDITLDEIKRSQQTQTHKTHSRVSGGSRKSGTSSKASRPESSVHIRTGDTVLQINGDAKIEVRQGEGGEPMLIIGGSTGRESSYNGSNGSGSRAGRSRAGSRMRGRDTIHEEGGYEAGL